MMGNLAETEEHGVGLFVRLHDGTWVLTASDTIPIVIPSSRQCPQGAGNGSCRCRKGLRGSESGQVPFDLESEILVYLRGEVQRGEMVQHAG